MFALENRGSPGVMIAAPSQTRLNRILERLFSGCRSLSVDLRGLEDIVALGEREGVRVRSKAFVGPAKENAILRQATLGGHQLIVLGTKAWFADRLHFGHSAQALIENAPCPILIVKS